MSKIGTISNYIKKCDDILATNNLDEIKKFIDELICVYQKEINGFTENLNSKSLLRFYEKINLEEAKSDIKNMRAMLINYKDDLTEKFNSQNTESKPNITFKNENIVTNNVNLNISLEQIVKEIYDLSNNILSNEEKEELEDKLRSLESVINSKDKNKISSKLIKLFTFALEKGPVVLTLVSSVVALLKDKILPFFQ